ncbi:MAG: RNA polymerase sigma factor [Clostridiales bacterium]|nr:RNA polymerase sigma factor [Clostridiales bacterium]
MNNKDVIRLFDQYSDDLYRFAVSFVGTKHDAEDIVQDVFMKLLSLKLKLDKGSEKTYLMTMTANKCRDHLRSSAHRTNVDLESAEWELQYYDGFTERNKEVFDELMRLEDQFRVPIYLHYYAGYSYREIAEILNLSESAVAMRISRGKDQMRIRLEDQE